MKQTKILGLVFLILISTVCAVKIEGNVQESSSLSRMVGDNVYDIINQLDTEQININHATQLVDNFWSFSDSISNNMIAEGIENYNIKGTPAKGGNFEYDPWLGYNQIGDEINKFEPNELFILESSMDQDDFSLYSGSIFKERATPNDLENWKQKFSETNPLFLLNAESAGLALPSEPNFINPLTRYSTIIAPKDVKSNKLGTSILCNLQNNERIGDVYRRARTKYYATTDPSNKEMIGLVLKSYSLYGNPLTRVKVPDEYTNYLSDKNWAGLDSNWYFNPCRDYYVPPSQFAYQSLDTTNETIFQNHLSFSYNLINVSDYQLFNSTNLLYDYENQNLVNLYTIRRHRLPKGSFIKNIEYQFSNPIEETITNYPSIENEELTTRKCLENTEEYSVTQEIFEKDNYDEILVTIKPLETTNCEEGRFTFYQDVNYDIEYYPSSPFYFDNLVYSTIEETNKETTLTFGINYVDKKQVNGTIKLTKNNETIYDKYIDELITRHNISFYTSKEEGISNYKLQYLENNEVKTESEFIIETRLIESKIEVEKINDDSVNVNLNIHSFSEEGIESEIKTFIFTNENSREVYTNNITLILGDNLVQFTVDNLEKEQTQYGLKTYLKYNNKRKTISDIIITNHKPIINADDIIVTEGELVDLNIEIYDADEDSTDYQIEGLEENWQTEIGDAGEYSVNITADDGLLTTQRSMKVVVLPYNQPPYLKTIEDIEVIGGELISLFLYAIDLDNDNLTYSINDDRFEKLTPTWFEFQTDIKDNGTYNIQYEVTDGKETTSKEFTLTINSILPDPNLINLQIIPKEAYNSTIIECRYNPLDDYNFTIDLYKNNEPTGLIYQENPDQIGIKFYGGNTDLGKYYESEHYLNYTKATNSKAAFWKIKYSVGLGYQLKYYSIPPECFNFAETTINLKVIYHTGPNFGNFQARCQSSPTTWTGITERYMTNIETNSDSCIFNQSSNKSFDGNWNTAEFFNVEGKWCEGVGYRPTLYEEGIWWNTKTTSTSTPSFYKDDLISCRAIFHNNEETYELDSDQTIILNSDPIVEQLSNIEATEEEELTVTIEATDKDDEELLINIQSPLFRSITSNSFELDSKPGDAGNYSINYLVADSDVIINKKFNLTILPKGCNPEDKEVCNGIDDNCNGDIDEGLNCECTDSDGGTNPSEKGITCLEDDCKEDKCHQQLWTWFCPDCPQGLTEYYCKNNEIRETQINCNSGCTDGACDEECTAEGEPTMYPFNCCNDLTPVSDCSPGEPCPISLKYCVDCGNGICEDHENEYNCPTDCNKDCSLDSDCGNNEFCEYPTCNHKSGTCVEKPENCLMLWFQPECGCDGETYSNSCIRKLNKISKAYDGECTIECEDSDMGRDYYTRGTLSNREVDLCTNSVLKERYCSEEPTSELYKCPNGCENGACEKGTEPYCTNLNTPKEGWYNLDQIKLETCEGCHAECKHGGTESEGWYSSCDHKLIEYADCNNEIIIRVITEIAENIKENSNIEDIKLEINNSTNLSQPLEGIQTIELKDKNNKPIVEFNLDFTEETLEVSNLEVTKQEETATKGSLIVKGIILPEDKTKTIYIDVLDEDSKAVCIKDAEISSISEITEECTGTNEFYLPCNNQTYNNYKCEKLENKYKVSGLKHSGVLEMNVNLDEDNDGFIAYDDCNDNNYNIKPSAYELCDTLDNNCNGIIDENCEENNELLQEIAEDTYNYLNNINVKNNLPQNWYDFSYSGSYTSPEEIGFSMLSHVGANKLNMIDSETAKTRITSTLNVLKNLENSNGLYYRYYDTRTLNPTDTNVPSIGNTFLLSSLITINEWAKENNYNLEIEETINNINLREFYGNNVFYHNLQKQGHWDFYSDEGRLVSFLALATNQITEEEFNVNIQELSQTTLYYDINNEKTVTEETTNSIKVEKTSWDGSLFTYLAPSLFINEKVTDYFTNTVNPAVKSQIIYSTENNYSLNNNIIWGISDAYNPEKTYCWEYQGAPPSVGNLYTNPFDKCEGLITPHASALALMTDYKLEATNNLKLLKESNLYNDSLGFKDSIQNNVVTERIVTLDQEWIFLSLMNSLDSTIWNYFYKDQRIISAHNIMYPNTLPYVDSDNDGYYNNIDCNDNDENIYPTQIEKCNNIDDNCNGIVDEIFNLNEVCSVGIGACQNTGVYICSEDQTTTTCNVSPLEPSTEICNNIDDDCNEIIDNDLTKTFGSTDIGICEYGIETCSEGLWTITTDAINATIETCNNLDDNCNNEIDEGLTNVLGSTDVGECAYGTETCESGNWITTLDPILSQEETCNNLDDNCDGYIDEELLIDGTWEVGEWGSCSTYCDGGIRTRIASCTGNICGGSCDESTKPIEEEVCNIQSCDGDGDSYGNLEDCDDTNSAIYPNAPELCDNLDNDCDGSIDEYLVDLIGDSNIGLCEYGSKECEAGTWNTIIEPILPQEELCDSVDNNCDGNIDETFNINQACNVGIGACQNSGTYMCSEDQTTTICNSNPLSSTGEMCDNIDNDCDGSVDEGLTNRLGTTNTGNCAYGTETCEEGNWITTLEPITASEELCDNLDNDCDGEIDEVFNINEICSVGIGACQNSGNYICSEDKITTKCNAVAGTPSEEICDNIDNNCDGTTDEELTGLVGNTNEGICEYGSKTCSAGTWNTVMEPILPQEELCDGVDNNCDGNIDENGNSLCQDDKYCNGQETCQGTLGCQQGIEIDCSLNNINGIESCNYNENILTYDYFEGFTSSCNEDTDSCTTSILDLNSECNQEQCNAECIINEDCQPTDCNTLDGCYEGTYRDYSEVSNICSDCSCTINECNVFTEIVTDNDKDLNDIECEKDLNDNDFTIYSGAPELCDGLDNNQDGNIDEIFNIGTSCSIGVGSCQNTGTYICSEDQTTTTCNAIALTSSEEICDNLDNDCDGSIDEELTKSTSNTIGECKQGTETCQLGTWTETISAIHPILEICDNLDNDCDGSIDEGFNIGSGCSSGLGECARSGSFLCNSDGSGTYCTAQAGNPSNEICDSLDNNCDGNTDENFNTGDFCSMGIGECSSSGIFVCDSSGLNTYCNAQTGTPKNEICDGKDNDCNGKTDEIYNVGTSCSAGNGECKRDGTFECTSDGSNTQCTATASSPVNKYCSWSEKGFEGENCGDETCNDGCGNSWKEHEEIECSQKPICGDDVCQWNYNYKESCKEGIHSDGSLIESCPEDCGLCKEDKYPNESEWCSNNCLGDAFCQNYYPNNCGEGWREFAGGYWNFYCCSEPIPEYESCGTCVGEKWDEDQDEVEYEKDKCPDTKPETKVNEEGCSCEQKCNDKDILTKDLCDEETMECDNPPYGDLNNDNCIDFDDFAIFSDNFGTSNEDCDFNNDNFVEFEDFWIFADNFGIGCDQEVLKEKAKLYVPQ